MSVSGYFQYFLSYSLFVLTLGVPFIFYSLYYQWRIAKNWCTICLIIIVVFLLELIVFLSYGSYSSIRLEVSPLSLFISSFTLSGLGWLLIKPKIQAHFEVNSNVSKYKRFKRNYSLFRLALKDSRRVPYSSLHSPIFLGKPDASLKLSLITNLSCGHCVGMHNELEKILKTYGNDIRVNIRFNRIVNEKVEKMDLMYFKLLEIYFVKGQHEFIEALGAWFRNKDLNAWLSRFQEGAQNKNAEEIFSVQYKENKDNELLFTPALIIGEYLYPTHYERSDLIYFISELSDDEELAQN